MHGIVLPISDVLPDVDPAALVAISFLAAYPNPNTRDAYRRDLEMYFRWYHREPGEPHSRSFHTVAALLASAS